MEAPWYTGLAGVALGGLCSAVTLFIQNVFQNKREEKRLIVETAYKDYELRVKEKGTFNFPVPGCSRISRENNRANRKRRAQSGRRRKDFYRDERDELRFGAGA